MTKGEGQEMKKSRRGSGQGGVERIVYGTKEKNLFSEPLRERGFRREMNRSFIGVRSTVPLNSAG